MNARERLADMVRTDRGDMNVYSEIEVRAALDTYRAEVLREAADALEARVADVDVDVQTTWAGMDAAYLRRMAGEATS
jgi:dihydropteroate synthase